MKLKSLIKSLIMTFIFSAFVSACGGSTISENESFVPAVPSGITATEGTLEDSVLVQWDAVGDAEYYIIYKALDTPESFKVISTRVVGLSYSDTPVSSGRTFYYRVAAGTGNKWSDPGAEVRGFALKGAPVSPDSFTIAGNEIGQVTLNWSNVINADSYNIYRCDVKYGTYVKINAEAVESLSYTDTDVIADKKYYYKIIAVNEYGEGVASEIISGTALQQVPEWPDPVSISASDQTFGEKVVVEWPEAQYASNYAVYRAPDNEGVPGEFALIAENVTGLVYEDRDTTLEGDPDHPVLYYYTVVAVSSGGQADSGVWDTGGVNKLIPAVVNPPTTVTASKGKTNVITVTWSEVSDANGGYSVYRSTSSSFTSPVKVADRITGLTFDDTTMAPVSDTETYYYKVSAWSVAGEIAVESGMTALTASGFTYPDIPGVPINIVSAMNYDNGTITLSWNAADSWTKRYTIYRSDNGIDGDYNLISENQTVTSLTEELVIQDGSIEAGVEYYYKVIALNDMGVSGESSGTAAMFTLRVPTNLSVSTKYNWDVACTYTYTITWTAVKGATGYEVGIHHDGDWDNITVSGGGTTTLTWKSDNYGGSGYNVRIRAINATPDPDIYSAYSAEVN